jgi:hypothetical protein
MLKLVALPLFILIAFASCSKSDDTPAFQGKSKEYKMYNTSSGTAVEAGSFTIAELADGNAKVTVRLNANFRTSGTVYKSNITTTDAGGVELVFSNLSDVEGNSGVGETTVLMASGSNLAVKYSDAITKIGYVVKVFSGANIQARGVIQ